jgi:hypothetical protein
MLKKLTLQEKINTAFNAVHDFRLGGASETLAVTAAVAAIASGLPPINALQSPYLTFSSLLVAGASGAWIGWRMFEPLRQRFTLPSTCKLRSDPSPVKAFSTPGLLLGYATDTGDPVYMPDWNLFRHMWIIGQSGVGKTVAGSLLMAQQIERGGGLLFVDGKLDYDNIDMIYRFAAACGRAHEVKIINPGDPSLSNTYSPVFYGDAFEATSRIMALVPEDPGADYYRGEATDALMTIIGAILALGKRYTIEDLVILLNNSRALEELESALVAKDPNSPALRKFRLWLERFRVPVDPTGRNPLSGRVDIEKIKKNLGGVSSKIAAFSTGDFGQVINTYTPEVRLDQEIPNGGIVYVALPTMGKQEAAYPFAKMLVGDVKTVCADLQRNPKKRPKVPFMCFLDEARSYISESWGVFFEQARSAGLFLLPAFQTLPQDSEQADVVDRVVGNTTSKLFFRIGTPETAEKAADHIGMVRKAQRSAGETSSEGQSASTVRVDPGVLGSDSSGTSAAQREAEDYLVSPKELMGLEIGEAILLYEGRNVINLRIPQISMSDDLQKKIGKTRINRRRTDFDGMRRGLNLAASSDRFITAPMVAKKSQPKEE